MLVVLAHGMKEPAPTLSLKNVSLDRISYFIAKASALPADAEDDVIVFRKTEKAVAELLQTHFFKSHALLSSTWQASREKIPSIGPRLLIKAFFQKAFSSACGLNSGTKDRLQFAAGSLQRIARA